MNVANATSEYTPRKACSPSRPTSRGRIMLEEISRCVPTNRADQTPIVTTGFTCVLSYRRPMANPDAPESSRHWSNALGLECRSLQARKESWALAAQHRGPLDHF